MSIEMRLQPHGHDIAVPLSIANAGEFISVPDTTDEGRLIISAFCNLSGKGGPVIAFDENAFGNDPTKKSINSTRRGQVVGGVTQEQPFERDITVDNGTTAKLIFAYVQTAHDPAE